MACIGVTDVISGDLTFVLLYFLPIGIASWYGKRTTGILFCFLSLGAWSIDYIRFDYLGAWPAIWDIAVTFGVFICYSLILSALRRATGTLERDAAELEQRVKERTVELNRRAEQLRRLMLELAHAEERERRRIAQVLHDNLQQILVGTRLCATALSGQVSENESVRRGLENIINSLDEAVQSSRSLTAELAPPVLYEKGLPEAFRWLARWMEEKYGISIEVNADDRADELDQELRVILFQVVRELLFNVVKHAEVKKAAVVLCYGGADLVSASVQDEGTGFDPKKLQENNGGTSGGFGLFSARERLSAIGGRLEIVSAPGCGTTSTVYVPVQS